jgi:phage terminase large subunit-like protein
MNTKSDKYHFDAEAAERPIKWIEKFCSAGDGRPMRLLEYQKADIIRPMFGWKNADGSYKHRFCYIEIGKGNGKSGLLSALAAYLCFAAGEVNAEIYCIATDRKQAGIVHEDIKKLVRANPELSKRSMVTRDTIAYMDKANKIKAVSSDVGSSHGWRPHALIFDELHTYRDSELFDSYIAGLIKRKNSMAFILTTAGKRETFAETIHDMCVGIKGGLIASPYWHTAIYAADPTDPPFEETTFRKANPAYGELIRPEDFDIILDRAKNTPSNLASYKQLHLNIWTGKSEDWVTAEEWEKCDLGITEDEYSQATAYGGLDLAAVRDLTAFTLFWHLPDGRVVWRCWFWVPSATVEARVAQENHKYREWVTDGWVRLTPGNAQDHDQIAAEIMEICSRYAIREIRFDRWGAVGAVTKLAEAGLPLLGHGQGFAGQSAPTKELERRIINGTIDHGGNPVLAWMLNNCKVVSDPSGNIKLNKDEKGAKIDGIIAGVMAMAALMHHEKDPNEMPEDWVPTFF